MTFSMVQASCYQFFILMEASIPATSARAGQLFLLLKCQPNKLTARYGRGTKVPQLMFINLNFLKT
jgi:hypothetical protein